MNITITGFNSGLIKDLTSNYLFYRKAKIPNTIKLTIHVFETKQEYLDFSKLSKDSNGYCKVIDTFHYGICTHAQPHEYLPKYVDSLEVRLFHELEHAVQYTSYDKHFTNTYYKLYQKLDFTNAYMLDPLEINAKNLSQIAYFELLDNSDKSNPVSSIMMVDIALEEAKKYKNKFYSEEVKPNSNLGRVLFTLSVSIKRLKALKVKYQELSK